MGIETMKPLYCFTLIAILISTFLFPDEGKRGVMKLMESPGVSLEIGDQYLFLIGINNYEHWMPLTNPVRDAKEIRDILLSRYYIDEVIELYDEAATKNAIISTFQALQDRLTVADSLLVFFAGHGYLDETTKAGCWLPVNAGRDTEEQAHWLPNSHIRALISGIEASHILLIVDSCFSGDILDATRSGVVDIDNEYFRKAYARISRQALTSGEHETVPDESEFAFQLKMALKRNRSAFMDPLMLYTDIRLGMTKTIPLIGGLKETGHQQGASFLLFLKGGEEVARRTLELLPLENPPISEPDIHKSSSAAHPFLSSGIFYNMGFAVGEIGQTLDPAHFPEVTLHYNAAFSWGRLGLGASSGIRIESTRELVPYRYTMYSIPLLCDLFYRTAFPAPFFISFGARGGVLFNIVTFEEHYPGLEDSFTSKPTGGGYASVGYSVTEHISMTLHITITLIPFPHTLLCDISAGTGIEFDFK
jgi:hypothetical protein